MDLFVRLFVVVALVYLVTRMLKKGSSKTVYTEYIEEGGRVDFDLEDGVSISCVVDIVESEAIWVTSIYIRGGGQWKDTRQFRVLTEKCTEFQVFPTPDSNWASEYELYGQRNEDKVRFRIHKKGGRPFISFGGFKFS